MPRRQRRRPSSMLASASFLQRSNSVLRLVPITRDDVQYSQSLSHTAVDNDETATVLCWLRRGLIVVWGLATLLAATGVYWAARRDQTLAFHKQYDASAQRIVQAFSHTVERTLSATAELSSTITSYAAATQQSFPTVTMPDFELRASYARVQSGSHILRWLPLVTDETRDQWEAYAKQQQHHAAASFVRDEVYRQQQDAELQLRRQQSLVRRSLQANANATSNNTDDHHNPHHHNQTTTLVNDTQPDNTQTTNVSNTTTTTTNDKNDESSPTSSYHTSIWSNGAILPRGDMPHGMGNYLPDWQQSPVNAKHEALLNMDWRHVRVFRPDMVETLLQERQALIQHAAQPIPEFMDDLKRNLALSQYRDNPSDFVEGLSSFFIYPVFGRLLDDDAKDGNEPNPIVGVIATNVYWKVLFSDLLSSLSQGIVCVVENGYNQTFSYRIDGPESTYLGMGDWHDRQYDDDVVSMNINEYMAQQARARSTAYRTVPLSAQSDYRLRIYPSRTTERQFRSNQHQALSYMLLTIIVFGLAGLLFWFFSHVVERRHRVLRAKVTENAEKAAAAERELNEFLSHEVRNPLAAAMAATTFVATALNREDNGHADDDEETKQNAREDIQVVQSSLHFINDFLRSMLDIHRASLNLLQMQACLVDLKTDVLDPVLAVTYKRVAAFEVLVECHEGGINNNKDEPLLLWTDPIRLKQVLLNLVRNACSFVERGFVRIRAEMDQHDDVVVIAVEDSGPGIPLDRRAHLFDKYQQSLHVLSQGTGLGLHLSKSLVENMGGKIALDPAYDSGVPGCPGTRFVIRLPQHHLQQQSQANHRIKPIPENHATGDGGDDWKLSLGQLLAAERNQPRQSLLVRPSADTKLPRLPSSIENVTSSLFRLVDPPLTEMAETKAEESDEVVSPTTPANRDEIDHEVVQSDIENQADGDRIEREEEEVEVIEFDSTVRVLFVDDDSMLRKLFVRAVRKSRPEWEVKEASSGEMALQICEAESFDLIFLDQYMASTEKQLLGTETAQAMRARGNTAILCGLSANDVRSGFMSAGADDFILKPFPCRGEALNSTLCGLLAKKAR